MKAKAMFARARLSGTAIPTAPRFPLWGGPNFVVLAVHRVVPAKLTTCKSDGFVLSGKRSHRLAARVFH